MSACSPKEELEWRSRLADHSGRQGLDAGEQALFTSLSLAIKPMGTVFGKPGQCNHHYPQWITNKREAEDFDTD